MSMMQPIETISLKTPRKTLLKTTRAKTKESGENSLGPFKTPKTSSIIESDEEIAPATIIRRTFLPFKNFPEEKAKIIKTRCLPKK